MTDVKCAGPVSSRLSDATEDEVTENRNSVSSPAFYESVKNVLKPYVAYPISQLYEAVKRYDDLLGYDAVLKMVDDKESFAISMGARLDKSIYDDKVAFSWSPDEKQTGSDYGLLYEWSLDDFRTGIAVDADESPLRIWTHDDDTMGLLYDDPVSNREFLWDNDVLSVLLAIRATTEDERQYDSEYARYMRLIKDRK